MNASHTVDTDNGLGGPMLRNFPSCIGPSLSFKGAGSPLPELELQPHPVSVPLGKDLHLHCALVLHL